LGRELGCEHLFSKAPDYSLNFSAAHALDEFTQDKVIYIPVGGGPN
jgi:hypothetical protein